MNVPTLIEKISQHVIVKRGGSIIILLNVDNVIIDVNHV